MVTVASAEPRVRQSLGSTGTSPDAPGVSVACTAWVATGVAA